MPQSTLSNASKYIMKICEIHCYSVVLYIVLMMFWESFQSTLSYAKNWVYDLLFSAPLVRTSIPTIFSSFSSIFILRTYILKDFVRAILIS